MPPGIYLELKVCIAYHRYVGLRYYESRSVYIWCRIDVSLLAISLNFIAINKYLVQDSWIALHIASFNGHTATVQALIDRGAQVDLQDMVRYSVELDLSLAF